MNDGFVVLAIDKGRNWTSTANDRYGEIDPVSDLAATDRFRPVAGIRTTHSWYVLCIRRRNDPTMHSLLVNRDAWRGKVRVGECANRYDEEFLHSLGLVIHS